MSAWLFDDLLLERYRHELGPFAPVERHTHLEYQIGLSRNCACHYAYRGATHAAPVDTLCILHPDEPHYPFGERYLDAPSDYQMLLLPADRVAAAAADLGLSATTQPYFPGPVLYDDTLVRLYVQAHHACRTPIARLEQDSRLSTFLTHLLHHHAAVSPPSLPSGREPRRVALACTYLHDNPAENVSLAQLADLVALSPYHFLRVFRNETGLTPHAYQTNLRIARAKLLLLRGVPASHTAPLSGFCDQSHFGRHFKRLVGTTPAQYAKTAISF